MNPNLQDTLNAIAQKLGTTAERVFPMLVAKERLDAWICIVVGTVLVVLCAMAFRWCYRQFKEDDDYLPGLFVISFAGFLCNLFIWCSISDAVYPEAAAIKSIIKSVK